VSIKECEERVETTANKLKQACALLPIPKGALTGIEVAITIFADRASSCCTQNGFWKTCIQPIVDAWKKAEIFGIPPDPSWD
jgi:hypothetical protein